MHPLLKPEADWRMEAAALRGMGQCPLPGLDCSAHLRGFGQRIRAPMLADLKTLANLWETLERPQKKTAQKKKRHGFRSSVNTM